MCSAERRRLCLTSEALAQETIEITGPALRHLQVLRLQRGDRVALFDGQGREVEARIVSVAANKALATPVRELADAVESPLTCWVVQAIPARPQRMDPIVRHLTEIGVACILPVLSERGQSFARQDAALDERHVRWQRIASAAAEQSRRRIVPRVLDPCRLAHLVWEELPVPVLLLDPGEGAQLLREAISEECPRALTMMIGPEGGWSDAEVDLLQSRRARLVSLGPRVLRTETAALVAVSIAMHRWGDLG
jgi:16S rRNA (uracil1498-N3)-methyltransferase